MRNTTILGSKFWIEGVTMPLVGSFGIFGNILAMVVLLSNKLQIVKSIRHLLVLLSAFDTLVIVSKLIVVWPGHWCEYYRTNYE